MGASCRRRQRLQDSTLPTPSLQERRVHQEELEIQQEQLWAAPPAPPDLGDALGALSRAYAGTGFGDDTADWEGVLSVDGINGFSNSALYGEINEQDFAELIFDLGLRPPAIIYDLGSGTGKLVNLAALIGFSATGIELEPGRHQRACTAARTLLRQVGDSLGGQPPRFLHTSFLEFDFSDADFVWANSIVFGPEMMEAVAKVARQMRPGSFVVTHKPLPGIGFELYREVDLRASWRPEGSVPFQVQRVLRQ